MVLFFHYVYQLQSVYGIQTVLFPTLEYWGKCAVSGFFLIMGFFAMPKAVKDFSIVKYLLKRIIRIMVPYVLAVTIIFVVLLLCGGIIGKHPTMTQYLLNIPLINSFFGVPYIDGAHWFVLDSLIFTLIVGILTRLKISPKIYLPVWLIINLAIGLLADRFGQLSIVYKLVGGSFACVFIVGALLGLVFNGLVEKRYQKIYLPVWLLSIAMAFGMLFVNYGATVGMFMLGFLAVFMFAIRTKLNFLERAKCLVWIGDISYSLYLIHQNIGFIILISTSWLWQGNILLCCIAITLTSAIMMGAAWAIHKYWEKPISKCFMNKVIM